MEQKESYSRNLQKNWKRYVATALALAWAAWWSFFGLASGISEGLSPGAVVLHMTVPGLVFLASAVLAWRTGGIGGAVLVLEGLAVLIAYPLMTYRQFPLSTIVVVILTMSLPPFVAGLLFIAHCRKIQQSV